MAEQKPIEQAGDRMRMNDHASAIDQVLAEHYDDDFKPLDKADADDDDRGAPDARDDDGGDDEVSQRRRKRRGKEERDEDTGAEEEDADEADDDDEGQPEEEPEDDADDEDASDESKDDDDDSDDDAIRSISDLAEALDQSEEEVMEALTVKITVGGEEREMSLAELSKGHMLESDYRQKTEEVATRRREVDADAAKQTELAQGAIAVNQQLLQTVRNAVVRSADSPEMQKLRTEDPSRYLLARDDIQNRLGALDQAQRAAAKHYQDLQAKQSEQSTRELNEYIATEKERLREALGDMGPDRKAALKSFAAEKLGIPAEDLATVLDHRFIVAFSRLMDAEQELETLRGKGAKAQEKAEEGTRRGRLRKRGRRGGQGRNRSETRKVADTRRSVSKAKKSGSVKDAAAAIDKLI